jgi:hypothetical protein
VDARVRSPKLTDSPARRAWQYTIGGGMMKKKIFVTVSGGCAYVMDDTVPEGFEVEIVDLDNIEAGDSFPSIQALNYCLKHDLYQPPRVS